MVTLDHSVLNNQQKENATTPEFQVHQLFSLLLANSNVACFILLPDCTLHQFNESGRQVLESLVNTKIELGMSLSNAFPLHIRKSFLNDVNKSRQSSISIEAEYNFRHDDSDHSRHLWYTFSFVKITFPPDIEYVYVAMRDISLQKKQFQELYLSEIAYKAIVLNSTDFISVVDEQGYFTFVSPSFKKKFAPSGQKMIGMHFSEFVDSNDLPRLSPYFEKVKANKQSKEAFIDYRMRNAKGEFVSVQSKSINLLFNPIIKGVVSYTRDITDRINIENQLKFEAYYDPLTKISNRQAFLKHLEYSVTQYREQNNSFAIIFIDLDRFKTVNDTLGHNIGDIVLSEAAARLASIGTKYSAFVARLGGDEFTMVVNDNVTKTNLEQLAQEIVNKLKQVFQIELKDIYIGCSIGINIVEAFDKVTFVDTELSLGSNGENSNDEYMRRADKAMYLAKQRGKGQYAFYNYEPSLQSNLIFNSDKLIRNAFDNDEFFVVYEPIIDTKTNQAVFFESHLAWQHNERGMLIDTEFIDTATDSSIVTLLMNFQIQTVCRKLRELEDFAYHSVRCGININSPKASLLNKFDQIQKNSSLFSINPSQIMLDIHPEQFQLIAELPETVTLAKSHGIEMFIDAFNCQSCNIMELVHSGYRGIKLNWEAMAKSNYGTYSISNSNARSVLHSSIANEDLVIITKLVDLFNYAKKQVIAYNIKTQEEYQFALNAGITLMQGTYFSKMLSGIELLDYVNRFTQNKR